MSKGLLKGVLFLLIFGMSGCGDDGYEPVEGPSLSVYEDCIIWSEKVEELGLVRVGVAGPCAGLSIGDYEGFIDLKLSVGEINWSALSVLYLNSQEGSAKLEKELHRLNFGSELWNSCLINGSVDECFTEMSKGSDLFSNLVGSISGLTGHQAKVSFEGVICEDVPRKNAESVLENIACVPLSFGVARFDFQ